MKVAGGAGFTYRKSNHARWIRRLSQARETKSLESWIWNAGCSIRATKEDYIPPLIFTKRLWDVFDDELTRIVDLIEAIRTKQLKHTV